MPKNMGHILTQLHIVNICPYVILHDFLQPTSVITTYAQSNRIVSILILHGAYYVLRIPASGNPDYKILFLHHIFQLLDKYVFITDIIAIGHY